VARALLTAAVLALFFGMHAHAGAAPLPNAVVRENTLPGTSSWQRQLDGDVLIYGSEISAAPGDLLEFHVSTPFRYRILVYRLGWYGGAGARQVACLPSCSGDEQGRVQPGADPPTAQPLRANWPVTDVLSTGLNWTSGYYLVEAEATSGSGAGHVGTTYVIVRQSGDALPSQVLVQVPVNTWEAYNSWGGNSLYTVPRAYRVSFDRPFDAAAASPLWWEIQLVRFLEREGYDVSYQTDLDTNFDPSTLVQHRLVIVAGHDEYWTLAMRDGFDNALAAGTNLAFTGSNDAYWNVRYEDGGRTILTYKSMYDPNPDPTQKTAMFREIGRPECLLEGVQHADIRILDHPLDYTVTAAGASDPWLAGTGLGAGDRIAGIVGREHDSLAPYPGCSHPGQTVLFHYEGPGDLPADAVKYTAASGARVFAAGAQEFSWALDGWRSNDTIAPAAPVSSDRGAPADPRVQQFMRNALDDLTRPAAPLQVVRHRVGDLIHVATGRPADVRVTGRLIYRQRDGGPPVLVCSNRGPCLVPRVTEPGTYRFSAEFVDAWGRASAPTYSSLWTTR
jgi:N,N-dimethylformamidase beta subunit-like protein